LHYRADVRCTSISTVPVPEEGMWIQEMESPLGILTAYWSELGLSRIAFGPPDDGDHAGGASLPASFHSGSRALAGGLAEYFRGGDLVFALAHFDWTGTPEFHRRVLERCAQIPRGKTLTYGQLASLVGSPGAARAVGQAMARNRWPLVVPCHRVVGHSGRMTGYSGAGGTLTKRALLDFEAGQSPLLTLGLQPA
jgi:methylated-DNA-[protein]-cysteine S-methyltransferase